MNGPAARTVARMEAVRWSADPTVPGAREVLRGVDLEIRAGESAGLIGRSGAGKTTLVTVLAGLLAADAGRVSGADGRPPAPGEIGIVFQEAERAFFEETVLQDTEFGPRNAGLDPAEARASARRALETVGLDPDAMAHRAPETLSGGEARRAAIAGVIARDPSLVVFDEPTTGLDADGVQRLRGVFSALRERGVALLIVSHDLDLVAEECDRVLVLETGRITWEGAPGKLADGLPADWAADAADLGGGLARVEAAMRERGWITPGGARTPEALAAAWREGVRRREAGA